MGRRAAESGILSSEGGPRALDRGSPRVVSASLAVPVSTDSLAMPAMPASLASPASPWSRAKSAALVALLAAALAAPPGSAAAQSAPASAGSRDSTPARASEAVQAERAARADSSASAASPAPTVTRHYDAARGVTTVSVRIPNVGEGVTLSATARTRPRGARPAPDSVALFVTRVGRERVLRSWESLSLILEGDRPEIIRVVSPAITAQRVGGRWVEQVTAMIAADEYARVAAARAVVGRIGGITFWSTGAAHDALRQIGSAPGVALPP